VDSGDLRALREFKADYPEASCLLLYGGEQPLFFADIRVIPIRHALRTLDELLAAPTEGGAAAGQ